MECTRVQEQLPAMADASLEARETLSVVEHLRQCPGCTSSWKRHLEIQHRFLKDEPRRTEEFWARQRRAILNRIPWMRTAARRAFWTPPRRLRAIAGVAAAALLAIVVALATGGSDRAEPGGDDTARVETPPAAPPAPPVVEPTREAPETPPPKAETPATETPRPAPEAPKPDSEPKAEQPGRAPSEEKAPEPSPEPMPPTPTEPAPPETPPSEPPPTPEPALALPGDAGYADRLLEEQLAIFGSRSEAELAGHLLASATRRLEELKASHDQERGDLAPELVAAYATLVGEGLSEALSRARGEAHVRRLAEPRLAEHAKTLAAYREQYGRQVDPAATACRAAQKMQIYRPAQRRSRHRVLAAMQETAKVVQSRTFDARMQVMAELLDRRVGEVRTGAGKAENAGLISDTANGYAKLLEKGVVVPMARMSNAGRDISASKAKLLKGLDLHLRVLREIERRAPDAVQEPVGRMVVAAQFGREELARLADAMPPDRPPLPRQPDPPRDEPDDKPPPPPPKDPSKDPKGPWNP